MPLLLLPSCLLTFFSTTSLPPWLLTFTCFAHKSYLLCPNCFYLIWSPLTPLTAFFYYLICLCSSYTLWSLNPTCLPITLTFLVQETSSSSIFHQSISTFIFNPEHTKINSFRIRSRIIYCIFADGAVSGTRFNLFLALLDPNLVFLANPYVITIFFNR